MLLSQDTVVLGKNGRLISFFHSFGRAQDRTPPPTEELCHRNKDRNVKGKKLETIQAHARERPFDAPAGASERTRSETLNWKNEKDSIQRM